MADRLDHDKSSLCHANDTTKDAICLHSSDARAVCSHVSIPKHSWDPMPAASSTFTTFSYQQAFANRLPSHKLRRGGKLDPVRFPPLVMVDVLQFPGSLVNAMGLASTVDIVHRMTPGKLRGWTLNADRAVEPFLRATGLQTDVAHGMVVFGRGRRNREAIQQHYGECFKTILVNVDIELADGALISVLAYLWIRWKEDESKKQTVESAQGTKNTKAKDEEKGLSEPTSSIVTTIDATGSEAGGAGWNTTYWDTTPWTVEQYVAGQHDGQNGIEW